MLKRAKLSFWMMRNKQIEYGKWNVLHTLVLLHLTYPACSTFFISLIPRHIWNTVKHLWWSFLCNNSQRLLAMASTFHGYLTFLTSTSLKLPIFLTFVIPWSDHGLSKWPGKQILIFRKKMTHEKRTEEVFHSREKISTHEIKFWTNEKKNWPTRARTHENTRPTRARDPQDLAVSYKTIVTYKGKDYEDPTTKLLLEYW